VGPNLILRYALRPAEMSKYISCKYKLKIGETFMENLDSQIVDLWSDINPVVGYTSGHLNSLDTLFKQTLENMEIMRNRIRLLRSQLSNITDVDIRLTASAVLTSLKTQLDMPRPSGAGPSGTGMSGIGAAGDGIFYIVLKKDQNKDFVPTFLQSVKETVEFEIQRWQGQDFSILVCKECLNTATYLEGALESLKKIRPNVEQAINEINRALGKYKDIFLVDNRLNSNLFDDYWPLFQEWDRNAGPVQTFGYPMSLKNYYQLDKTAEEIEIMAQSWLDLDLAVTIDIAQRIAMLLGIKKGNLQTIWDEVTKIYMRDFSKCMDEVFNACNQYGAQYIISFNKNDKIYFESTPDYLVNLITGGGDYAINYLNPKNACSQLYLTKSKNTSLLTMINILVHEASHGFNFVLSAKHANKSPLLNLNTALEVPMTEGMAFYREYQYWAAAQTLLNKCNLKEDLNEVEKDYLALYGDTIEEQEKGVLCAQLETYIWRVIRYIRALCDVKVNGGNMTYTDFISWAAQTTGLSEETLHGECFTLLASPGYAPCYALGCASYAYFQKMGISNGISEMDFNTFTSKQGFYSWPQSKKMLENFVSR
jgi:hypothetical protein